MFNARRIQRPAIARRWLTAAVASGVIAAAGIAIATGDEPDATRPPISHPPTSERTPPNWTSERTAPNWTSDRTAPNCPKPRCWWVPDRMNLTLRAAGRPWPRARSRAIPRDEALDLNGSLLHVYL